MRKEIITIDNSNPAGNISFKNTEKFFFLRSSKNFINPLFLNMKNMGGHENGNPIYHYEFNCWLQRNEFYDLMEIRKGNNNIETSHQIEVFIS
jgi:hypothetical protein